MKKEISGFRFWLRIIFIIIALVAAAALCFLLFGENPNSMFSAFFQSEEINRTTITILLVISVFLLIGGILGLFFLGKSPASEDHNKASRPWTIRELVVGALCIGLSFILSLIAIIRLPNGGIITPASMLPIFLFSYIYGMPKGVIVGVAYGLLEMISDPWILSIPQVLLDYVFAFAALSIAGLFRKSIISGIAIGSVGRLFFHFLSGILFFATFAPENTNVFLYSLFYQCSYILPEMIICILIALIPGVRRAIETLKVSSPREKN